MIQSVVHRLFSILKLALTFASVCVAFSLHAQQDPDAYLRYETEDVGPWRQRFSFTLPMVSPPAAAPAATTSPLDAYFANGVKLYVDAPAEVDRLVASHKWAGQNTTTLQGYRVQIFTSPSREDAQRVKANFMARYPETLSYLSHIPPTYRIRVGDFIEQQEANSFCRELRLYFPEAFVVNDEIPAPKFKRSNNGQ